MSADFDAEIAQRIKSKGKPDAREQAPSRIEEINTQIAELDRLYYELDYLTTHFENGGVYDRMVTETRAEAAMVRAGGDKDALLRALALEHPATLREVLIFVLRALDPVQTILNSSIKDGADAYEMEQGYLGSRLLRRIIPALEALSGTTRADLGCDCYYYRDQEESAGELIEGLKVPLAKEEAVS